jgi:hypothetical protein
MGFPRARGHPAAARCAPRRESPQGGQGRQGGDRGVIGVAHLEAQELDRRSDDHVAEVVVVDIAAGEPGVVGREAQRADRRQQIREVHGLLPAHHRMPEVRMAQADQQPEGEGPHGHRLLDPPEGIPQGGPDGRLHSRPQEDVDDQAGEQGEAHGRPVEIHDPQAGHQPWEEGEKQWPQDARERVSPIPQAGEGPGRQRPRSPSEQGEEEPPGQHPEGRPPVQRALGWEDRPIRGGRLLARPDDRIQHQEAAGLGILARRLPDHLAQIHGFQHPAGLFEGEIRPLAEDPDRRMVVDTEGLLGAPQGLLEPQRGKIEADAPADVVDLQRSQARLHVEDGDEVEAQPALKEGPVVGDGHRVAQGETGDRPDQALAGEDDPVRPLQPLQRARTLLLGVVVIPGHLQALVDREPILPIHPQGQAVVPVLVGDHRGGQQKRPALGPQAQEVIPGRQDERLRPPRPNGIPIRMAGGRGGGDPELQADGARGIFQGQVEQAGRFPRGRADAGSPGLRSSAQG